MKVIILNFLKPLGLASFVFLMKIFHESYIHKKVNLGLASFVFLMKIFHESYIHKKVNSTKFERNCSLEYYHMT